MTNLVTPGRNGRLFANKPANKNLSQKLSLFSDHNSRFHQLTERIAEEIYGAYLLSRQALRKIFSLNKALACASLLLIGEMRTGGVLTNE